MDLPVSISGERKSHSTAERRSRLIDEKTVRSNAATSSEIRRKELKKDDRGGFVLIALIKTSGWVSKSSYPIYKARHKPLPPHTLLATVQRKPTPSSVKKWSHARVKRTLNCVLRCFFLTYKIYFDATKNFSRYSQSSKPISTAGQL